MAIEVTSSFYVKTNLPLDGKFIAADQTARNAIASGERFDGLLVYVVADKTMWQLQGGITNSDWSEAGGGGGGGITVVADATARLAIVSGDRYDGYLVYQLSDKSFWQLQGGILDANWVLLDLGIALSATQTLSGSSVITLAAAMRQRVKIKSSGTATVTLPNGTIDGQQVWVQGDDATNFCTIADGGNVSSNGDRSFFLYTQFLYTWDNTATMWIIQGA